MNPIPYGRHSIDEDDIAAVTNALRSDYLTQGPLVEAFEDCLAAYHGCRYAVAFCNGTAALHGAYVAAGLRPGEAFAAPVNTFAATANAGLYVGGKPILCDITLEDYNMDLTRLAEKLTPEVKIVTPVSYAGYPVDIRAVRGLAGPGVVIIHDAAHAPGARLNGASIMDGADMAMVSFHPVKHVATGEGGVILTDNPIYAERLRLFRSHGITKNRDLFQCPAEDENAGGWYYEMQSLGYNYRLTDIQCALGLSQMRKLDASIARRNAIADAYRVVLGGLDWLTLPSFPKGEGNRHAYHLYPVLVKEAGLRRAFYDYLRERRILAQVHYVPLHYQPYYQKRFGYRKGDFPVGEDFYSREISLPMFPTLSDGELDYVMETVRAFKGAGLWEK